MYGAMANAQQRYKQQGILTANPVELIVMLYDGCIKQLKMAAILMREEQADQAFFNLSKAYAILMELVNSLDLRYSIGQELLDLYEFMIRELIKANAEDDVERIEGVVGIMEELRDAWRQVAKGVKGSALAADEE